MLGVGTNCDDVGLRLVTYAKELVCRWVRGAGVATVPCPSTMWIPHLYLCIMCSSSLLDYTTNSPIVLTAEPPLPQLTHTEQLDTGGNLNFYANGFM